MKHRGAFGLLEILVALAILAVLGTVILQYGRAMVGRGEAARCLGNLRQLGAAFQLYLAEHNMVLPDMEAARASIHDDEPVLDTVLAPYVETQAAFACPADRTLFKETGTSYFWNSTLNGQPLASLVFLPILLDAEDLSRIPLVCDKEGWHRYSMHKVNWLYVDGHVSERLEAFTVE